MAPGQPAAVVQSATTAAQRTLLTTLAELERQVAAAGFEAPALIIIGTGRRLRGGTGLARPAAALAP